MVLCTFLKLLSYNKNKNYVRCFGLIHEPGNFIVLKISRSQDGWSDQSASSLSTQLHSCFDVGRRWPVPRGGVTWSHLALGYWSTLVQDCTELGDELMVSWGRRQSLQRCRHVSPKDCCVDASEVPHFTEHCLVRGSIAWPPDVGTDMCWEETGFMWQELRTCFSSLYRSQLQNVSASMGWLSHSLIHAERGQCVQHSWRGRFCETIVIMFKIIQK